MNRMFSFLFVCLMQVSLAVASAFNLKVEVTPDGAGSLSTSGGTYEEGSTVNLRTSSHTGYVFKGWYDGETLLSSSTSFNYKMPAKDVLVKAKYEYNPTVPGNPSMPDTAIYYSFSAVVSPHGAGTLNGVNARYAAGTKVSLRANINTGYKFVGWLNESGVNLSTSTSFNYTMPNHDVMLTALYSYDPNVPANPDSMPTRYTVTVASKPMGGGTFNTTNATVEEGGNLRLYAYTNTGYLFLHWENEKGEIVSSEQNFYYVIPHGNTQLYGVFDYNPAPPSNPKKNYWNKELGQVVADDFTPGSLGSAVSGAISGSNRSDVAMIIVAGKMNDNDFGIANDYTNCTLLDLSRVSGITCIPSYAFDNTNLESAYLPACIEKIGTKAFSGCKQLTSLTVYAMTPPALESNVFQGVQEGLIVYVPSAAIAQYVDAEGWKDFTILPIQEDIRNLTVSLPEGANAKDYAQMWLELTNTKSGQKMHYVMMDRTTYTFANIIRNTSWNAVLRNQRGDVFGKIDNIDVKDEDVSVTFSSLSKPQNVSLSVKMPDGSDVTAKTQVTWVDAKGNYIAQSTGLSGLVSGYAVSYRVTLPQDLAMQFVVPQQKDYIVRDGNNNLVLTLEPIKQVTISGSVKDSVTKAALSGATVSVSQTFGGKYSKTVNTKTDAKGNYALTVSNVPTSLAVSASGYISQTMSCESIMNGEESIAVSDISLKEISGAVINLGVTYTKCPEEEGDEDTFQEWYADYNNIGYSIYNKTKQKAVNQFNVQYPQIVLLEDVDEGDVLELTATSKVNAFMPVKASATIDAEQNANAAFNIVELGKIKSTFVRNSNASVVGSLYDANGKLVKSYDYSNASLTINDLADGRYTLVTMGSSKLFNTIYDLSQLPQTGLVLGADYTQTNVEVKSGNVSVISIAEVPSLNESKLYYTGDNTSFTVNKSSIVAGNYLTLTGYLDFKSAYAANVSNVNLIVDLPESCEFVENSVMVGNSTSSYILQNNRITIPIAHYTDRVRFCIIPTLGGEYAPSALAQFDIDGRTITQPIGSVNYTAKDLSISVPSTVAKTTIPISGTAIGASTIDIYDNDALIGQTTSLANGIWSTTCELNDAYNLSKHNIYAKITTKVGLELLSESHTCTYDINAIQVSKVTMYHNNPELNKTYKIIYDFLNPTNIDQYYIYYIYNKVFSFTIDFTVNDPEKITNVMLNVITGDGTETLLDASYDKIKGYWIACGEFGDMYDGNIPVNVSVDYYYESTPQADRLRISNDCFAIENAVATNMEERHMLNEEMSFTNDKDEAFLSINDILDSETLDVDALEEAYSLILNDSPHEINTEDESDIEKRRKEFESIYKNWEEYYLSVEKDSLLDFLFDDEEVVCDFNKTFNTSEGMVSYKILPISEVEIEQLENLGYSYYDVTDSSRIYYNFSSDTMKFVDTYQHKMYVISSTYSDTKYLVKGRMPLNDYAEGVDACARSIGTTIKNIKTLWESGKLSVKDACEQFNTLYGFAQCYYTAILSNINYNLVTSVNNAIEDYNSKIKKGEELRDISESRIHNFKDKLVEHDRLKRQIDNLLAKNQETLLHGNLSESEFKALAEQCNALKNQSNLYQVEIESYKSALKHENSEFAKYKNQVENLIKGRKGAEKAKSTIKGVLAKLPKSIIPGGKAAKIISVGGKLAGFFGEVLRIWSFGVDVADAAKELREWEALEDAIYRKLPCSKDYEKATQLYKDIHSSGSKILGHYIMVLSSEVGAMSFDLAGGVPVLSPTWWGASLCDIYVEWAKLLALEKYIGLRGDYWLDIMYLRCTGNEPKDPRPKPNHPNEDDQKNKGRKKRHEDSKNKDTGHGIDPSGFVYEGVFSNRIEGVTATCFYKEEVEDMYGDLHENIVKWDAEEYAQENPLFTDENGYYRWDVPQGLWQVKFEKEGYETTYSDWLPVPPPQLEVNIAMKQNVQPNVKSARAYEDAVVVEFDKYMMPELLNTDNIIVMAGGKQVEGSVELLNEEVKYEGETETFASKLRFNAKAPFEGDEVTLMVNNRVKSYAGIRMQDDYSQAFAIEQEIRKIVCDSAVVVGYGYTGILPVTVLPASASAGKMLTVRSSSSAILGTDITSIKLDENGAAMIPVSGELPGTAALTFNVEGYDITATAIVNVEDIEYKYVMMPKASIASGTTVDKGTKVTLFCETEGATIYYTLDGSCPCDEATRLVYTEPLVISEDVTIKAMAVAEDMTESDIVEFTYIVDKGVGIDDVTIGEDLRIYPLPVRDKLNVSAGGKIIKSVTLNSMSGSTVVTAAKQVTHVTLDVSSLASGIYVVNVATEDKTYSRKIMKVE